MDNKIPHILIVDDDANLLGTMSDIFKLKGFEPVIAQTGAAALAQLERHRFDLALLDLRLEDMSGLKVLSAIKARSPRTECILLTGHASQNSAIEAIQLGVYDFFQKPFDMEQVLLSIQRALEKSAAEQALRESERFAHATVDALSSHIAILDETGAILAVNSAWREFAEANSAGMPNLKLCEDANYLTVCDTAKGINSEGASAMAAGIRAVISGKQKKFLLEYPCHSPEEKRWFTARVTRFPGEGALRVVVAHENISERKHIEESLRRAEENYRGIFENALEGIFQSLPEGRFIKVNPAFARMLGYESPEELVETVTDIASQTYVESPRRAEFVQKMTEQGTVTGLEFQMKRKDGKTIWVSESARAVYDDTGRIGYFEGSAEDITERKQAQEAQQQSELQFRALFELSPDAVMLIDPHDPDTSWTIIDCNEVACLMNGYRREEFIGHSIDIINTIPGSQTERNAYMKRLQGAGSLKLETFHRHKNGTVFPIEVSTALIRVGDRELIIGIDRDITERKQGEEALAASEAKLRALVEQVPAVVYTESAETRETLYISPQVEKLTGYTPAEWGKDRDLWKKITHPEDLTALLMEDERTTVTHDPFQTEYRILTRDGRTLWIRDEAVMIENQDGTSLFWQGVMYDITERKYGEKALKESEERYRSIFDGVQDAIFIESKDGRILGVNRRACEMYGYKRDEFLEKTVRDLVPEARDILYPSDIQPNISSSPLETVNRRASGELFPVEISGGLQTINGEEIHLVIIRDITERKQAETALGESQRRLTTLMANLPGMAFRCKNDYEWTMDFVSEGCYPLTGYHPAELINNAGIIYGQIIHSEDRQTVWDVTQAKLEKKRPYQLNYRIITASGEERWVWEQGQGVYETDGDLIALEGFIADITERKRAEEALHESEERFRVIFEKANDAIHIENDDDKILAVNSRMCELMGYSREELLKMQVSDLQAPEVKQVGYVLKNELARHGNAMFETLNLHRDGRRIPVEISIGVIERPSGVLYISVIRDITERKQAEQSIRQHVKELELLYESGLTFSQLLNPREIAQKIIELLAEKLNWHHTAIRLVREQDELELVAFDQTGLKDKIEAQAVEARINNLITHAGQGLSGWALEQSKIIRSGDVGSDPHYVASYPGIHSGLYVPLRLGDHMLGVITIESEQPNAFSEADERLLTTLANQAANAFENARLYEETSRYAQELERHVQERTTDLSRVNRDLAHAVRVKDEFLASMSHELRTPLTGILGLSEVLQLKIYGELNDKQSNTIKTIEESGRHLLDLINDILDLSKIEAGKLELQFAPCSLADVCQASLQLIKGMAQQKHQNVHYTPPAEPIVVRADARRLKQMLVNLLSNAIKFTPPNGELGLEIQTDASERKFKLTVWDKGIGIKPEDLQKLFKPFTQLDSGLAREYSGTGLGLSLVQHLTEMHNGGIEVESKFGEGSRFTIILPWSPENTTPIPYMPKRGTTGRLSSSAIPPEYSKLPLVMFADDNEMVLQMVADFLGTKQYRVMKVRNGTELLSQAAEFHPDIMLVDIQMPGIGGMETIRRIRSHPDPLLAAAPVIAVTALAMPTDRERCLRAGANDYISKPLKLKALAAAIQKLLDERNP